MHNYIQPRADVDDSQSAIDEDSPRVEGVDDAPEVAHHNLAYDDDAPPANLGDTSHPLEVETRAPLLATGARVGAEVGVGVAFVDVVVVVVVVVVATLVVDVVVGAQRRPRRVPRQPSQPNSGRCTI